MLLLFSDHSDEVVILDLEVLAQVLISKLGVLNQQFIICIQLGFGRACELRAPVS
jgi:hypothetical protein